MPVVLKRWSVPTGEPDNTERVPSGSVGGRQKRSRKTTSLAAYPISCLAVRREAAWKNVETPSGIQVPDAPLERSIVDHSTG